MKQSQTLAIVPDVIKTPFCIHYSKLLS